MPLAYLPSLDQGTWYLGPLPIRAYAIAILLGVAAAVLISQRRYAARGGPRGTVLDVATALSAGSGLAPVVTGEYRLGDVRHVVAAPDKGARGPGLHSRDHAGARARRLRVLAAARRSGPRNGMTEATTSQAVRDGGAALRPAQC